MIIPKTYIVNHPVMIIFFLFLMFNNTLLASQQKCKVEPIIMYSIASIEGSSMFPVGYPYIISLNNKQDVDKLLNSDLRKYFIDNRTINCKNESTCINITRYLIKRNIKNLDCGAFQINYLYHKVKNFAFYFNLKKSYYFACNIITKNNQKKWSWKNISDYHSFSNQQNAEYKKKLITAIYQIHIEELRGNVNTN